MARSLSDRRVVVIFWKRLTQTDAQALLDIAPPSGTGQGAKHLPLRGSIDIPKVLGNPNPTGGTQAEPTYTVPIEGPGGVAQRIEIRFDVRGHGSNERREWLVARQHGPEQHLAWKPGGKLPAAAADIEGHYLMLVRIADGSVHARIAFPAEVDRMPDRIRRPIAAQDQGLMELA